MESEALQEVLDAIDQKDEAIQFIVGRMQSDVDRLKKLGLEPTEIARKVGLIPAKVGRPKGTRVRKQSQPTAA